jgi:hypothetical protein
MNNPYSTGDVHYSDYDAAFNDVAAENNTIKQAPFTDYEKQFGDVAEENNTCQQIPFADYERGESLDDESHD